MKRKYQILASIVFIVLACFKTEAQQPDFLFEYPCPEDLNVGYGNAFYGFCTLEIGSENGVETSYILAVNLANYDAPSEELVAKVVKVSKEGNFLKELTISNETENTCIDNLFLHPNEPSCCLAIGRTWGSGQTYQIELFLAKFDVDLNLLWQRKVELPENYAESLEIPHYFIDSQGDIVCYTDGFDLYSPWTHSLYFRMSAEGEIATLHESSNLSVGMYNGGLFEYQDGSGDYGHIVTFHEGNNDNPYLVRTDRNFDSFSYRSLPIYIERPLENTTVLYEDAAAKSLDDGSVIIASEGGLGWWDSIVGDAGFVIALMKFNSNDSVVSLSHAGGGMYHTTDSIKQIDCRELDRYGENLYCCFGMYDPNYGFGGLQGPNSFGVVRMDMEANIIWERYYQDYRQLFKPYSITATSDEGCLIAGMCCNTDYKEPQAFVLKFFPDGTLSIPEAEAFVRPYAYWPNPAQDELHLQFSPDVTPTQIELFDIQGRLVKTQRNGLESIYLEGLSSGTYTMLVTLENGKVFSDKVVKN